MPSCPFVSMTTPTPPATVVPLIPAIKVAVWVPFLPTRMVLDSPAIPLLPMSMLLLPGSEIDPG